MGHSLRPPQSLKASSLTMHSIALEDSPRSQAQVRAFPQISVPLRQAYSHHPDKGLSYQPYRLGLHPKSS